MDIYLIAHTSKDGHDVGQAEVTAVNETDAKDQFKIQMPERDILKVGIKGYGG